MATRFCLGYFGGIEEWRDHGNGFQYFRTFNLIEAYET